MSINRTVLSGNLVRDAELRTFESGFQVLDFTIAFNNRRKNRETGEWEDQANYIDCKIFGSAKKPRAEKLSHVLHKGFKVAVDGKLQLDKWEKDGQTRSKMELLVDDIELMTRRADGSVPVPDAVPESDTVLATEDIPF